MVNVVVQPNEQSQACLNFVVARIENRRHRTFSETERQNALLRNEKTICL